MDTNTKVTLASQQQQQQQQQEHADHHHNNTTRARTNLEHLSRVRAGGDQFGGAI